MGNNKPAKHIAYLDPSDEWLVVRVEFGEDPEKSPAIAQFRQSYFIDPRASAQSLCKQLDRLEWLETTSGAPPEAS